MRSELNVIVAFVMCYVDASRERGEGVRRLHALERGEGYQVMLCVDTTPVAGVITYDRF